MGCRAHRSRGRGRRARPRRWDREADELARGKGLPGGGRRAATRHARAARGRRAGDPGARRHGRAAAHWTTHRSTPSTSARRSTGSSRTRRSTRSCASFVPAAGSCCSGTCGISTTPFLRASTRSSPRSRPAASATSRPAATPTASGPVRSPTTIASGTPLRRGSHTTSCSTPPRPASASRRAARYSRPRPATGTPPSRRRDRSSLACPAGDGTFSYQTEVDIRRRLEASA